MAACKVCLTELPAGDTADLCEDCQASIDSPANAQNAPVDCESCDGTGWTHGYRGKISNLGDTFCEACGGAGVDEAATTARHGSQAEPENTIPVYDPNDPEARELAPESDFDPEQYDAMGASQLMSEG